MKGRCLYDEEMNTACTYKVLSINLTIVALFMGETTVLGTLLLR